MSSVSKVVFGNTTVMDITDSTVDSDTLLTGTKAYGANGDPVIGGVVKSWTGTAAQYAQEASQIPDGTQVNILDDFTTAGEPMGIADIYSTVEREIGVWTDGKPLYQKTISFGALPNNTTKSVEHSVSNIDTKFIVNAFSKNSNNLTIPIPYATAPTTDQAQIYIDNIYINIKTPSNMSAYTGTYITINYTKTTDQPGSGKYVPSGALAIHYSTDEQIIGTWIDGKPLYQKVVDCGNKNLSSSWTTLCTISNVDTPVSLEILRSEETTYKDTLLTNGGFNAVFDNSGAVKIRYTVSSTYNAGSYIVIVKYTKTTD